MTRSVKVSPASAVQALPRQYPPDPGMISSDISDQPPAATAVRGWSCAPPPTNSTASSATDPASAARIGRQLGAKYYVTGKLGAVDERLKKVRRVQYSLFIQVIEVENSLIRFQNESARSKAIKK